MAQNNCSGGATFTSALLLAFIILKLCDVIDWSWWWVFAPVWIPLSIVVVCTLILSWIEK